MASGRLNLQPISTAGTIIATTAATATDGDKFQNDGKTYLEVSNGGGVSTNVTISAQSKCNQGFTHDLTVAVAAGVTKWIGTFNPNQFNDASGDVLVTCNPVASVTIAAIKA